MLIERMRKRLAADRASFIEPCLPLPADKPPSGANWIHEIKHDGFRLVRHGGEVEQADRGCGHREILGTVEAPDVASAKAAAAVQFGLDEIQRNRIMVQELA